ncbi:hypothetical protein O181_021472 [Austropuccinia psidii MF-1]|uniref:Uncharacterized protein n=1 Tax=Austropuccinia psidii MF-1 TaxID=1389203 RepID=A0A9Q3CFK9_9BASI|nr:hypothetical protein [Austropuccinia psidii MF-1]
MCSSAMTDACDACQQEHKKCFLVAHPIQPHTQSSSHMRHPCEKSFVVGNVESTPEHKWTPRPQTGRQEFFCTISLVPSSINFSTPILGHNPMVTSLLDQRKMIIWPMNDGDGKRTFKLGLIVTMSCHPWD